MNIDELSKLLGLPKATIKRWIRQGKIPVREMSAGFLFDKKEIEKWAREHNIFLQGNHSATQSRSTPKKATLLEAMNRGGIFFNVKGRTITEVFRKMVQLTPLSPEVDKAFLVDLLQQREKLAPTGVSGGVALPHPRYPLEKLFNKPIITTCFLEKPIDFKAIDGEPVFVLFMLLSPSTQSHLSCLSRLSFCLRTPGFISFLNRCGKPEELIKKIQELETALDEKDD